MFEEHGSKNFGEYLDRTVRVVRLDLLRRFKEVGVDITPEQWIILSSLAKNDGHWENESQKGRVQNDLRASAMKRVSLQIPAHPVTGS